MILFCHEVKRNRNLQFPSNNTLQNERKIELASSCCSWNYLNIIVNIFLLSPSFSSFLTLIKHEFSQLFFSYPSRLLRFFTCSTFIMSHRGHKRVSMMISHLPWIEEKLMWWWLFVTFYLSYLDKFFSSSIAKKNFFDFFQFVNLSREF